MRLLNTRDTPPGGWRYVERATGGKFEADSWLGLLEKVAEHRRYRGLDVSATERDVVSQLCVQIGEPACKRSPGDPPFVEDKTSALTSDMVTSFNRAVFAELREVAAGSGMVDAKESARRAECCRRCPFNKPVSQCSCSLFYKTLNMLVPKARRESGVEVCMVCGCSLAAKVLLPAAVVKKSTTPGLAFPEWCWQRDL